MAETRQQPSIDEPASHTDSAITAEPQPPPGWYPNPDGSASERWWSGTAWTDAVYTDTHPPTPVRPSPVYLIQARINGLAIASFVCSLIGIVTMGVGGIPGVILGHVARVRIRRSNGAERGDGFALAGLIIGYIMIAVMILGIWALSTTEGGWTY